MVETKMIINFDPTSKDAESYFVYFQKKTFLIIESSTNTRTSIKKSIAQLGVKSANIIDAVNIKMAKDIIEKQRPHFVLAPKSINNESSLELLDLHISHLPDRLNAGFFITTNENSLAEVALALEYEMDGLISTPFTASTIINTIATAVHPKISPKDFQLRNNEGRLQLIKGNQEKAKEHFQTSLKISAKNFEAYFYLGMIAKNENDPVEAVKFFELSYLQNPKHYRTLIELSNIYLQLKQYKKAYEINLDLVKHFPIAPSRIPDLIKLSIANQKYDDLNNYFRIFDQLNNQSPELKIAIAAGFAVVGRYYLQNKNFEHSQKALKLSFINSDGKYEILDNIYKCYVEMNLGEAFLNLFDEVNLDEWPQVAQIFYCLGMHIGTNEDYKVINLGEKLLRKGLHNPHLYKAVIERGININRKLGIIEAQVLEASSKFPDLKHEIEKLFEIAKSKLT